MEWSSLLAIAIPSTIVAVCWIERAYDAYKYKMQLRMQELWDEREKRICRLCSQQIFEKAPENNVPTQVTRK